MSGREAVDYQSEIDQISDRLFTIAATNPQGHLFEIAQLELQADVFLSSKVPDERIQIQAAYLIMNATRITRMYRAPFALDMAETERRALATHLNKTSRSVEEGYRNHIALYDQRQRAERDQQTTI